MSQIDLAVKRGLYIQHEVEGSYTRPKAKSCFPRREGVLSVRWARGNGCGSRVG